MALKIDGDMIIVKRIGDIDANVDRLIASVSSRWSQTVIDGDFVYLALPPGTHNSDLVAAIQEVRKTMGAA